MVHKFRERKSSAQTGGIVAVVCDVGVHMFLKKEIKQETALKNSYQI